MKNLVCLLNLCAWFSCIVMMLLDVLGGATQEPALLIHAAAWAAVSLIPFASMVAIEKK